MDFIKSNTNNKNLFILDVGCGSGGTTSYFTKFGFVVGIDFSFSALKFAIKRGNKNVLRGNLTNPPLKEKSFDVITALDVIEHIKDDVMILKKLKELLKSKGILIITVPAFQFLWSEHDVAVSHFRRYNKSTLINVLQKSGFKIIRISYFVSFLFPFVAVYRLLTRHKIHKKKPEPNMVKFPTSINNIFSKIMIIEQNLLKHLNLPFGSSILCIAEINDDK